MVLGHFISAVGIQVDLAKIEVIQTLPIPTKLKDVRSFLGHAGYYRHLIRDFSKIASPLYKWLIEDAEFSWMPKCNESFLQLKKLLTIALFLQGPNWNFPFHIYIDASDYAIGVVLGQQSHNLENAINSISKRSIY